MKTNHKAKYWATGLLLGFSTSLLIIKLLMMSLQNEAYYKEIENYKTRETEMMSPQYNAFHDKKESQNISNKRFNWPNGKKAALSLSYDDGFKSHYDFVAPLLAKSGIKATFYPIVYKAVTDHFSEWALVADMGHELGNHSLFHPCRRENINPAYHLENYNQERYYQELDTANFILSKIDHMEYRTFAYPCSQYFVGNLNKKISVKPIRSHLFVSARSYANGKIITPETIDLDYLPAYSADITLKHFDAIESLIEESKRTSGWIILVFHEISNKDGYLRYSRKEHLRLVEYLTNEKKNIWTDTILNISSYLLSSGQHE